LICPIPSVHVSGLTRLEGREAVRAHFAAAAGGLLRVQVSNLVVHDTGDPEVVIAEFDYEGQVTMTGRSFRVANIQVLRVRNGQIVSSCDYHNHLALAAALGQLHELASSLARQDSAWQQASSPHIDNAWMIARETPERQGHRQGAARPLSNSL
jgi:ketosteroid isomerase-like protein